jgi:hypothetical protein
MIKMFGVVLGALLITVIATKSRGCETKAGQAVASTMNGRVADAAAAARPA